MEQALAAINATYEDAQIVYEYELLYRELVQSHFEIAAAATKFQRASERVNKEIDNGTRLLAEIAGYLPDGITEVWIFTSRDSVQNLQMYAKNGYEYQHDQTAGTQTTPMAGNSSNDKKSQDGDSRRVYRTNKRTKEPPMPVSSLAEILMGEPEQVEKPISQ